MITQVKLSSGDLVTQIRASNEFIAFLHEQSTVSLVSNNETKIWQMESVCYDALFVNPTTVVLTTKNMPIRIYNILTNDYTAIYHKKQHSETFLSPIRMALVKENVFVGAGSHCLALYDSMHQSVSAHFKSMNKCHCSNVAVLNQNLICVGLDDGSFNLFDIREDKIQTKIKVHMDAIFHCERVLEFNLITSARKDNYTYNWDIRNLESFVYSIEYPSYSNQRRGLLVNLDRLFFGTEDGKIFECEANTSEIKQIWNVGKECVSSLCSWKENSSNHTKIIYSCGSRQFTEWKCVTQAVVGEIEIGIQ